MVATSGLTAASTRPLATPTTSVAAKRTAKFGAAIVAIAPPMCPRAASRRSAPIPSRSQSGPPSRIEKPKPQNAAPAIQPTSVLLHANRRSKSPMMSPRIANDMAVAIRAMQLARNSRRVVNVSAGGASDGPLMGMRTMPEILTESSRPFLLGTLANGSRHGHRSRRASEEQPGVGQPVAVDASADAVSLTDVGRAFQARLDGDPVARALAARGESPTA